MATIPVQIDEVAMVREAVEQVPLPKGVRLRSVHLGSDWEGKPAWRIVFAVSKKMGFEKSFIRSLTELTHHVVDRVTELPSDKFPYVDFEESR